jgi:hypothetical protein
MKEVLQDLLTSKKALAAAGAGIAYLLVRVAGRYGIALDADTAAQVGDRFVALALVYVGGQAVADHGKEAAKISSQAPQSAEVAK